MRLQRDDDGILRAELGGVVGCADLGPALLAAGAHADAAGLHRREMRPARDQRDLRPALCKLQPEVGADRARADDADFHNVPPLIGGRNVYGRRDAA